MYSTLENEISDDQFLQPCRSPKCVVASAGMQADRQALHKVLSMRHTTYQFNHRKPMSVNSVAQLLSTTLYYKRFFPYYTFNLCAGLDEEGRGAIYTYDAIGSFERVGYGIQGSGKELIQPVLDNQLQAASPLVLPPKPWLSSLPLDKAVDLIKDAYVSAGERDIYTVRCCWRWRHIYSFHIAVYDDVSLVLGVFNKKSFTCVMQGDFVEILIMTKDGVKVDRLDLKKD